MFKKILIANRGEIAVRVIRACKELDIKTAAIYSDADKSSMHVKMADEAIGIGRAASRESYLNMFKVVEAAQHTGADGIHPGYGFLSENSKFAMLCNASKIKFIGPPDNVIKKMGSKIKSRQIMVNANVAVVPGNKIPIKNDNQALRNAGKIGYPVIIKACAGGGGKGMRIVESKKNLIENLHIAKKEAMDFFGDEEVYLERYIKDGKHIEFQILADEYGNILHIGERECSIQRKHQKLIEETPSPALSKWLRYKMGKAAIKAAHTVGYCSTGTIEFLLDRKKRFYFMEMNTRIQVEHPITELVSGIDLVKAQILIAGGAKLNYSQREIKFRGHAIECRINAEEPAKDFLPSPGKIKQLVLPSGPGVRVDTYIYKGYRIPHFYDSMIAKVIVLAEDRMSAISRMQRALNEFYIKGIETNIPLHQKILNHPEFISGRYSTNFLNDNLEILKR